MRDGLGRSSFDIIVNTGGRFVFEWELGAFGDCCLALGTWYLNMMLL